MKKALSMILACIFAATMQAQDRKIQGTLIDKESGEAMMMATVQLLKTDSTYAVGAVTNENGHFTLTAPKNGKFIVKVSNVGYKTTYKDVEMAQSKNIDLGKWKIAQDAVMLKEVSATAQALKVTVQEDTFVYNASAYRTPEGSAVEELVKLIPGASVDESGNVSINGKQVKKIKMDGKEFMNGDTQTALKNLSTSIVEKVKAYEEKSDRSRITGIDDGEDEMTLDFSVKAGMNKGFLGNADAAYGTHDRYTERIMGMLFKDKLRAGVFTNFNNTNDMGFGGRGGGFFGRRNGLNTSNMVGININYENTGKLKWDGSVRWNHNTSDQFTKTSSESFLINNRSFSNSLSQNYSKNKSWNGQMRIEWTPDTMTNIMFRPSFSWSDNDARGGSASATFDEDPFLHGLTSPYEKDQVAKMVALNLAKNYRTGGSLSYGDSKNLRGRLQINRKLNSEGRNITLNLNGNLSESNNRSLSTSNVNLFQVEGQDYIRHRFNLTPSKSWDYDVQLSYSEPIAKKTYLQFSYKFKNSYSKSDRATYDFSDLSLISPDYANLLASLGISSIPLYRDWGAYNLDDEKFYGPYEDKNLSRFTEYKTYTHDFELQIRRVRDNYNFNFGILAQPQQTNFIQNYLGKEHNAKRSVFNISPTANFRYYFTKQHQLRFVYRGSTSQPSMAQMVDIVDNSDPLHITVGNPNLKPSFTNNFRIMYNNVIASKHYQVINFFGGYSNTRNATASQVVYDKQTGGQTTRYENINGRWNANGNLQYNIALDTLANWNLSVETGYRFNNNVNFVNSRDNFDASTIQRNITRVHTYDERLSISYRNSWLNIEPDGSLNYVHSTNMLNPTANLDTWSFSYGTNLNITLPWGTSLASDIHMRSRRGYSDASLNTNELIWNAQIAQSFLRGKNLTVSLQFYDILKNQSNLSRSINEMSRTDTEFNSINSYAMLHVIYRFNFMGGKQVREKMEGEFKNARGGRQMMPPPGGMGGFPGPPPGGFGPRH